MMFVTELDEITTEVVHVQVILLENWSNFIQLA